jgi:ADP-ribose pyrophosphatase
MTPYVLEPTWSQPLDELRDSPFTNPVRASVPIHSGVVWDIRADTVDLGDEVTVRREFIVHTGAVGVLALDDADRVLLIRQYRHPVASMLWELVAGLMDMPGESPAQAAARELVEEAGLIATQWHTLVDFDTSPGGSSEVLRMYLARGLEPVAGGRPPGHGEERDLPFVWMPLDQVVEKVLAGEFTCPTTVNGALAAFAHRARNWTGLRPPDVDWPIRDQVLATGRVRA